MGRDRLKRVLLIVCAVLLVVPLAASAQFCIGNNCGVGRGPSWHCHSINSSGVQCWDHSDDSCESQPGFSTASGAQVCSVGGGGAVGSQLPTLGGVTIFKTTIQTLAVPRSLAGDVSGVAGEGQGGGGAHFAQLTTAAELESWDIGGFEGETTGLMFGYNKQNEGGRIVGFGASYQEAEPDVGTSSELMNLNISYGHTLGETWKWGVSGVYNDLSGLFDDTFMGGAAHLSFNSYQPNGSVLSGGVIAQFLTADTAPDDYQTVSVGLAYGIPIAQRMAVDFDAYYTSVLEPDTANDSFFNLGGTLSYYMSSRFGLTLGYKVLEGLDNFDSSTITLGTSSRWQ